MKAYNHLFVSWDNFESFLDGSELDCNKEVLVRVHSGIHTAETMQVFIAHIKDILPNAIIIGCSTEKVICEGRIEKNACLISITEFEKCEMRLGMFSCYMPDGVEKEGDVLCEEVSNGLVKGTEGLLLVFYPINYYKAAKFVCCMNCANKGLKMIGGAAYMGDSILQMSGSKSFVVAGTEVSGSSMAAVLITSPEMSIYVNAICGVENVGQSYEVNKVKDNYLLEMGGEDCAIWYERQLGKEELLKDPTLVNLFPLVREDASQIAYNVVYEPFCSLDGPEISKKHSCVSAFTEITAGNRFALGYFNPQKIISQLDHVYQDLKNEPVEVLFAYDCMARTQLLHDCAKWEVGQFYTTNISGAMLAGEISNINGENTYANSTFVLAGISENKDARLPLKGSELKDTSVLQHNNIQMINYLLMTGNKQLSLQLSEQRDDMEKALFYYEKLELDNQAKYLIDRDRLHLDKIAIFSLKNERMIRLFVGQNTFLKVLKNIYKGLGKRFNNKGLYLYSYGECSLLIAAQAGMSRETFIENMKKVFDYLNGIPCEEFVLSYGCGIVTIKADDQFQKAEEALHYGSKNKIPFMQFRDIPEEVLDVKEEMHIHQVIREALVEDRIIPYYQGIYDNKKKKIGMYEALMRIQDGQGKIYYPNQFLPVAKEYDLYESLSGIMVKKIMEKFLDKNEIVTINLNVRDIYDRDILETIFKFLKKAAHPENFIFELVESEEVRDYQFVKQFADSIHEHGAKIAIDDFGSGFSNLMHIVRIDADIIKIDGEIIKGISDDIKSREFVEIINTWCNKKGKEVIAEYVEDESIQKVVEGIGVSHSQGFYFARPQPWRADMYTEKVGG